MRYKIVAVFLAAFLAFPICVHAADELYLGGDSVGIEVRYDGVMVTGTYAIQIDGALYDPKDHGISNGYDCGRKRCFRFYIGRIAPATDEV